MSNLKYPKTLLEFEEWFNTEAACSKYLYDLRWPKGFCCPYCGNTKAWFTKRGLYRCEQCDVQTSVTAGTIFEGTRQPLRLWFRAIWHIVTQKNGINALGLQRVLGLGSYRTAWTWLHKLRRAMVRPDRDKLTGIVEVDEAYIGGKKSGKRGRGAAGKTLVLVAVEVKNNRAGRIRLERIADASSLNIIPAVQKNIEKGSTVQTDNWESYNQLPAKGYRHIIVRKNSAVGENLLPLANLVIALLKRWLQGTHQGAVRPSHLDYYLDEFTFRFNRRTSQSRGKLFYRLIQQAVLSSSVAGHEL